jgi:hypothetical protein
MEVQFVSSFKERMNKGGMLSNNFLPMDDDGSAGDAISDDVDEAVVAAANMASLRERATVTREEKEQEGRNEKSK